MGGLVGYGAYIPYYRLQRSRIAGVLGGAAGTGARSAASFDEDTTSMAVAAGRAALAGLGGPGGESGRACIRQLFFATTAPAYADKTNATAVHAALRLPAEVLAVDMAGAVRSGAGALVTAAQSPVPAMAVLADIRTRRCSWRCSTSTKAAGCAVSSPMRPRRRRGSACGWR